MGTQTTLSSNDCAVATRCAEILVGLDPPLGLSASSHLGLRPQFQALDLWDISKEALIL